jgi:hypothetical protein
MLSTVTGGAMPPHAPQFFAMPDREGFTFDGETGAHPLAPFLAQLQIERLRPKSAKQPAREDR